LKERLSIAIVNQRFSIQSVRLLIWNVQFHELDSLHPTAKNESGRYGFTKADPDPLFARLIFAVLLWSVLFPARATTGIDFSRVATLAEILAANPYQPPPEVPDLMRNLTYKEYQNIRFDPNQSLWHESKSKFQVMLVPPGLFYTHQVRINVIDSTGVHTLPFNKSFFTFDDPEIEKRIPPDLGYAGLKLTFPLSANEQNQFLVFAGASYFRAVGADHAWGISVRGIAVDTGLPSGEEFPSFVEFWLERPAPSAQEMVVYGLLDGPGVTGAYQFNVRPGRNTVVKVTAKLFARKNISLIGVAPLTSMFFYGENTGRPVGEWRKEIHDSDGLLIHNGVSGEWLWRPLLNPKLLEMDFFATENLRGFGLLQRDTEFSNYQDLAARYNARPSAWVEPIGDWGLGKVVLVQLPTDDETHDNIVAFWTPDTPFTQGQSLSVGYQITFGGSEFPGLPLAQAARTFVGDGNIIGGGQVPGAYRILVDFSGGALSKLKSNAPVKGVVTGLEGTEVVEQFTEFNEPAQSWRLSMLVKPAEEKPVVLRAYLTENEKAVSETWTYRLPRNNDIRRSGE
jgi:periplasmic glucans biosynthesis protein